jgi:cytidylate kinase
MKNGSRAAARTGQSGYGESPPLSNAKRGARVAVGGMAGGWESAGIIRVALDHPGAIGSVGWTMIIAVDGPAASGKGTLAQGLARHYGLAHLDTGLLYRAVGLAVKDAVDTPQFEERAIAAARALDPKQLANLNELTAAETGVLASKVAVIEDVRKAMRDYQRNFAHQPGGAVLDGRDIGTVICPDADVKLFIEADSKARMERRARQLEARGLEVDRYALYHQIEERDARDRANPHGGFFPAPDAHLLDTTRLDIEAALRAAVAIVDGVMAGKAGA